MRLALPTNEEDRRLRKRELTELDLNKRRTYYSKLFRWSTDRDFFFDECEFLYDSRGKLMGVDYRRTEKRPRT